MGVGDRCRPVHRRHPVDRYRRDWRVHRPNFHYPECAPAVHCQGDLPGHGQGGSKRQGPEPHQHCTSGVMRDQRGVRVMASTERDAIASPASNPTEPIRSSKGFLIFGAPLICDEEKWEVLNCLETGWLGTGPKVAQLERELRDYKGAPYAVAVNSCTAALHGASRLPSDQPGPAYKLFMFSVQPPSH